MSKINFKKLVFRNFMSYGNIANTFIFKNGMIMCTGSNGFGKSTIVEAINYALYGTSYRGMNKPDLINTMNPGCELSVELEFDVWRAGKNAWDECRILRTLKHSNTKKDSAKEKFEFAIFEDGKWVVQNKRAGFSQDDFEKDVLGFDQTLFRSGIALNTQEGQPFMALAAQKRREITESIISMQLGSWKKFNAQRLNQATMDFGVAEAEYNRLGESIISLEDLLKQMRAERASNIDALKGEIAELNTKIAENKSNAERVVVPITGLIAKIAENDEKIVGIRSVIAETNRQITDCTGKLANERELHDRITAINDGKAAVDNRRNLENALATAKEAMAKATTRYEGMGKNAVVAEKTGYETSSRELIVRVRGLERETAAFNAEVVLKEKYQQEIAAKGSNLKPIEIGIPCPRCGKPTTAEDVERSRAAVEAEKAELREQYKSLHHEVNVLKDKIKTHNDEIAALTAQDLSNAAKVAECNQKIMKIEEFERSVLFPVQSAVAAAQSNLDACDAVISRMGISVDGVQAELDRISGLFASNQTIRDTISGLNQQVLKLNSDITEIMNNTAGIRQEIEKIRQEETRILAPNAVFQNRIGTITAEIERLEKANADDAIGSTERKLANAKRDRESALNRMNTASDTKAICTYITELASDDGLKAMIFDKFVPIFNESIARNLERVNLPVSIVFDRKMDATYTAGPGLAPTYKALSQGQQRKIGFAISMAFRDFASLIGNFKLNFVSFDEVLDQSTDNNAMMDMLEIIRGMVDELGCVFIITHRWSVVADMFDYQLEVTNNGTYSKLGELTRI